MDSTTNPDRLRLRDVLTMNAEDHKAISAAVAHIAALDAEVERLRDQLAEAGAASIALVDEREAAKAKLVEARSLISKHLEDLHYYLSPEVAGKFHDFIFPEEKPA